MEKNLSCGEISDFYVYMTHVEKSEISPHVKEFQISPQNRFVSVVAKIWFVAFVWRKLKQQFVCEEEMLVSSVSSVYLINL